MGVNHGRSDIGVSQELLNCPDVVAVLQQVRPKGMMKSVTDGALGQTRLPDRKQPPFLILFT
jgi:hypothetical protein